MYQLAVWDLETDASAAITIDAADRVRTIAKASDDGSRPELVMSRGWIDIQVNGALGVPFNSSELTASDVHRITEHLRSQGVTQYCPTLITDSRERLKQVLRTLARAASEPPSSEAIIAIHLEGPYISPVDGPRGAHPRRWVRPPDRDEFLCLQDAAAGLIGIVTLAPELPGALEFIEWLRSEGVIPAIGHTDATPEQIFAAADHGALLATHVSNAASEQQHRHRSNIYAQLADDRLMASFIADGHHVPSWVLKVFLRAKTPDRSVLISDLMHWAGMPPGTYEWEHLVVEVTPEGAARVAGEPRLAGATAPLSAGVTHVLQWTDFDLKTAVRLVTDNVRLLLEHSRAARTRLKPSYTLFRWGATGVRVDAVICNGRLHRNRSED